MNALSPRLSAYLRLAAEEATDEWIDEHHADGYARLSKPAQAMYRAEVLEHFEANTKADYIVSEDTLTREQMSPSEWADDLTMTARAESLMTR